MAKNRHYTAMIIGDSPATYICAIYLFTANISTLVVRHKLPLEYECTFSPGLDADKDEYTQRCCEQAKNMGIEVIDGDKCVVKNVRTCDSEKYAVDYDGSVVEADFIVVDSEMGQGNDKYAFVVDRMVLEREAIVVAGTGCMIAFDIKEHINSSEAH